MKKPLNRLIHAKKKKKEQNKKAQKKEHMESNIEKQK